jgi:hypothetical protein
MECKIKKSWIATELDEHGNLFPIVFKKVKGGKI